MSAFSRLKARLDRKVFDRLTDGEAVIDGVSIAAMYDKSSFQFGDTRGTETVLTVSQSRADELGVKPTSGSDIQWAGRRVRLAMPPLYEDGLIKLVIA